MNAFHIVLRHAFSAVHIPALARTRSRREQGAAGADLEIQHFRADVCWISRPDPKGFIQPRRSRRLQLLVRLLVLLHYAQLLSLAAMYGARAVTKRTTGQMLPPLKV